jgi:hypothetical protein
MGTILLFGVIQVKQPLNVCGLMWKELKMEELKQRRKNE